MGNWGGGQPSQPGRRRPSSRAAKAAKIFYGAFSFFASALTVLGFFGVTSKNIPFDSIPTLSLLAAFSFLGAALILFVRISRNSIHSKPNWKIRLVSAAALTIVGITALAISLIQPNVTGEGHTNGRTLMESINPKPEKYQVQRDGSTATVSGVEMQAKSCPQETSSFTVKSLEKGDRVSFSLKGFPGDNKSGSYAVTARGAGISENYRISDGAIRRIQANARERGDLNITISAQHRPELGSSCDSTNEVLAIEDAVLN